MAIDTHVHLDALTFADDLGPVMQRAGAMGVTQMITIGVDLPSSCRAVALTRRWPGVWASVGLHPHEAHAAPASLEADLARLAADPRVVAIGETGLDFYRNLAPPEDQRRVFRRQIDLAQQLDLPLIIHSRAADDAVVQTLDEAGAQQVVMHCFMGDRGQAERCLERGWYLAFGGAVTYRQNDALRAVVATVPDDRLLFETDAPYLAPVPHRGKRNEPAWITLTIACCAELRGTTPELLAARGENNAATVFTRLAGAFPGEA